MLGLDPVLILLPMFCLPQSTWTEEAVVRAFLEQSPAVREARARVAAAEAEARGKTLYSNPFVTVSHEGAGRTEFYQAGQPLPVSGRLGLLRQAGALHVQVVESEGAQALWDARTAVRRAFYRLLASQRRSVVFADSLTELDGVIRVLREREQLGEGSKLDRLRAELERSDLQAETSGAEAAAAVDRGALRALLPPEAAIESVTGEFPAGNALPSAATLAQRAMTARQDVRAERRRAEQWRMEQRAAERLRIPEPVLNAGVKRAETGVAGLQTGAVVGLSIPIPVFNQGRTEVSRLSAEQERSAARIETLARRVNAEVESTRRAWEIRQSAHESYARARAAANEDLVRVATVAYQEGETGILQLLDAYRLRRLARLREIALQEAVTDTRLALENAVGEELQP